MEDVMRTTRNVVFMLLAVVTLLTQVQATNASPMCTPYDGFWIGCTGVPGDESFCATEVGAFCDDQCQGFFSVWSNGNTCSQNGQGIYEVACYCDVY